MRSHEKRLLKLLHRHRYELVDSNGLGVRLYRLPDCRDVLLYQKVSEAAAREFTRQINADTKRRDPENTPELEAARVAWEAQEKERLKQVEADRLRVKDLRLGGLSARLTETQVDAVTRRAEQLAAEQTMFRRMMTHRPQHDIST